MTAENKGMIRALQIGNLRLEMPVYLAPMSGVTDLPFRRLAKRLGAPVTVSEMVADNAALRQTRSTLRRLAPVADEHPRIIQLVGHDPACMADAARMCADLGADMIDINFGCPARKVTEKYCGSALMRDPDLAARLVEATAAAITLPVTAKMRTGWDDANRNAPEFARRLCDAGAGAIAVHGRSRAQKFSGTADWRFIRTVKRAVAVPVIANGDIATLQDAAVCLAQSGADGVMIGRAARGRPWFPAQVAAWLSQGPDSAGTEEPLLDRRFRIIVAHYRDMLCHYGRESGLRVARKHLAWYSASLRGGAEFRRQVMRETDPRMVLRALERLRRAQGVGGADVPAAIPAAIPQDRAA